MPGQYEGWNESGAWWNVNRTGTRICWKETTMEAGQIIHSAMVVDSLNSSDLSDFPAGGRRSYRQHVLEESQALTWELLRMRWDKVEPYCCRSDPGEGAWQIHRSWKSSLPNCLTNTLGSSTGKQKIGKAKKNKKGHTILSIISNFHHQNTQMYNQQPKTQRRWASLVAHPIQNESLKYKKMN